MHATISSPKGKGKERGNFFFEYRSLIYERLPEAKSRLMQKKLNAKIRNKFRYSPQKIRSRLMRNNRNNIGIRSTNVLHLFTQNSQKD